MELSRGAEEQEEEACTTSMQEPAAKAGEPPTKHSCKASEDVTSAVIFGQGD